jgi:hypothetical protein
VTRNNPHRTLISSLKPKARRRVLPKLQGNPKRTQLLTKKAKRNLKTKRLKLLTKIRKTSRMLITNQVTKRKQTSLLALTQLLLSKIAKKSKRRSANNLSKSKSLEQKGGISKATTKEDKKVLSNKALPKAPHQVR